MKTSHRSPVSGQASQLAERLLGLSAAIQRAAERDEVDLLAGYLDQRQQTLDELAACPIIQDVDTVRGRLQRAHDLDGRTMAFLTAELESIQRELNDLPRWRSALQYYHRGDAIAPAWVDHAG